LRGRPQRGHRVQLHGRRVHRTNAHPRTSRRLRGSRIHASRPRLPLRMAVRRGRRRRRGCGHCRRRHGRRWARRWRRDNQGLRLLSLARRGEQHRRAPARWRWFPAGLLVVGAHRERVGPSGLPRGRANPRAADHRPSCSPPRTRSRCQAPTAESSPPSGALAPRKTMSCSSPTCCWMERPPARCGRDAAARSACSEPARGSTSRA
jgi:hypothetical protein